MILRAIIYVLLAGCSVLVYGLAAPDLWQSDVPINVVSDLLALVIGLLITAISITRYFILKDVVFAVVGFGFLFAASYDAFSAISASETLRAAFTGAAPIGDGTMWVTSRQILSSYLVFAWLFWLFEERYGFAQRLGDGTSTLLIRASLLSVVTIIALFDWPNLQLGGIPASGPQALGPAVLFGVATIGFIARGKWRDHFFDHWLVIALIISLASQVMLAAGNASPLDARSDIGYMLKVASYLAVLIGLMVGMFALFRQEVASAVRFRAVVDNVGVGILTIDDKARILTINRAIKRIFGRLDSELVGKSVDILAGEPTDDPTVTDIATFLKSGATTDIGVVHEVVGQRFGGRTVPLEVAVTRMNYESGPVYLVAILDITERKEMDRMKSEFVATVSHELRTPLTVILGYLPLLIKEDKLPEAESIARMAASMDNSGKHLLALVNDLLDISRIEAGRLDLHKSPLSIKEVIESATEMVAPEAAKKGLEIKIDAADGIVYADKVRLRQVLINLLDNAVKFTDEGRVSVTAIRENRGVKFTVQDTGIGIHADHLDAVFDRFRQLDGSRTRQAEGTGLGLAITRSLVELHGGQIKATSALGRGTRFVFDIPSGDD